MTGIVSDLCSRMDKLASERAIMETIWQQIATFAFPDHQDFYGTVDRIDLQTSNAVQRGRQRFDDTAVRGTERLSAVMESLATPQNEFWHGLAAQDPFAEEPTDPEEKWYDKTRDYIFKARYKANSGFMNANQRGIRSMVGFGTGIVFMEEGFGRDEIRRPFLYQWIPLNEGFLAVNAQSEVDTHYRRFTMTARQMVEKFGAKNVADPVRTAFEGNEKDTKRFNIIHAVEPRQEAGSRSNTNRNSAWASYYVDRDNNMLIGEKGFFEFPYLIYHWNSVGRYPYAESPVMLAYSDIKGLNALRLAHMKGTTQFYDPTLGAADDDGLDQLNMTPGEINYGWLDANGKPKAAAILTNMRPDIGQQVITEERQTVNSALYIDMFQALAENPDMTATQAMLVAQQKAQLLGPAGGKVQQTMSHEVERAVGILTRKGAFAPGAALEPPETLQGRDIGASFTSPMDRLRMASQGIGLERTLARAVQIAQFDPSIMDEIDGREALRFGAKVDNAPMKMFRDPDEVDAIRAQRAQQQQMQQALMAAKTGGEAAKNIVPAMGQLAQMAQNGGAPTQ